MRRREEVPVARWRSWSFAACATCTLWLIVQNTILLSLLPPVLLPTSLAGLAGAARVVLIGSIPMLLVPLAFALGWLASRREDLGEAGGGERDE